MPHSIARLEPSLPRHPHPASRLFRYRYVTFDTHKADRDVSGSIFAAAGNFTAGSGVDVSTAAALFGVSFSAALSAGTITSVVRM